MQPGERFPPAPWRLHGDAWVSLWRLPTRRLPPSAPTVPYLSLGASSWLTTIWARYAEGGTLAYQELAVAVLARGRGLLVPACTVCRIWVDDERAAEGGRQLWQIPKKHGAFTLDIGPTEAVFARLTVDGAPVASLHFRPSRHLPARPALSGFVIQPAPGGPLRTRCAGRARPVLGQASWDFAAAGPLGFLHGQHPLFSLQLAELRASFGV